MFFYIGFLIATFTIIVGILIPFVPNLCRIIVKLFNISEYDDSYEMMDKLYRWGAKGFKNIPTKFYSSIVGTYLVHNILVVIISFILIVMWPLAVIVLLLILFLNSKSKQNEN